jgi:hypothetical protein
MGTIKKTNAVNSCDAVYGKLSVMHKTILEMKDDLARAYGADSDHFKAHEQHLVELANFVEWKLNLLTKDCPFDWKGRGEGVESTVSVRAPEDLTGPDFSGGYIGG